MNIVDNFNYENFLKGFEDNGYKFIFFNAPIIGKKEIILKHDVDFDCELALKLAEIESKNNIKSTYFFLLRNEAYDAFSNKNLEIIKKIKEMGHRVSIHFDPVIYDNNFVDGLITEVAIFEKKLETKVNIISIHRPNVFFTSSNSLINGLEHTYLNKYFKDIKYLSDSSGRWRFGHPFDSMEFSAGKSFQILTHPVWWTVEGQNNLQKIENLFKLKGNKFKAMVQKNYKKIFENYETK
jgi:hypothetical protein